MLLDVENTTSGAMTEPAYIEALIKRDTVIQELDAVFIENRIDVMLTDVFSNIAPFTGFPSMTIPIGKSKKNNIPFDSHWMARRYDEAALLKVCYVAEQLLNLSLKPEV